MGVVVVAVVMGVPVVVGEALVGVLVHVALAQVQPDPDPHQGPGDQEGHGDRLAQGDGEHGTEERGDGEVGAGAGGAEVSQRDPLVRCERWADASRCVQGWSRRLTRPGGACEG